MPLIADRLLDAALAVLDEGTHLHICTDEPANFGGLAAVTLGNKGSLTITAVADGTPNGRSRQVAAFTGGTVTGTGSADCWALVDTTNSRLLASGTLPAAQTVTIGNTWSLTSPIVIRFPDAV
jgi:hypothetical protein